VCGAGVTVSLSGLTIAGPWPVLDCSIQPYGLAVTGGATAKVRNVVVNSIREDPLNGCQRGIGILVGRASPRQVGHATLRTFSLKDYQKDGIKVSNTGSKAKIS